METQAMKTARTLLGIALLVAVLELSHAGLAETATPPRRPSIPYVATRNDTVQDMLWIANVGKDDVVYDLGSGDGRIVIAAVRDFGARRAVGIEIDPERIGQSRKNTQKAGVTDRVEFIQGDLFTTDLPQASVVTLFLGHESNINLRPKMLTILNPGTRIVSHQFGMGEWQPDKTLMVRTVFLAMWGEMWSPFKNNPRVPDYTGNESHFGINEKIMMWIVPAPVAGIWQGKIETENGPQDLQLTLYQRLSEISGTFQLSGKTKLEGSVRVDLWGNHVRFWCHPTKIDYGQFEIRFDGHIHENTMQGTIAVADQGQLQERAWEAQRDKVDFTGTWEWPCASEQRSVKLCIERRDGHLIATYTDRDQTTPVTDFYDYGGGLYFTLLIGRDEHGIKITEDTGWLIGEGVIDHGALKGRIEFYPYKGTSDDPRERRAVQPVFQDWVPRLVKP
jgi:SAM-dependent methyltransferase